LSTDKPEHIATPRGAQGSSREAKSFTAQHQAQNLSGSGEVVSFTGLAVNTSKAP